MSLKKVAFLWDKMREIIDYLQAQVSWEELRNVTRMSNLDGPASVYNFHFWILVSIIT